MMKFVYPEHSQDLVSRLRETIDKINSVYAPLIVEDMVTNGRGYDVATQLIEGPLSLRQLRTHLLKMDLKYDEFAHQIQYTQEELFESVLKAKSKAYSCSFRDDRFEVVRRIENYSTAEIEPSLVHHI